MKRQKFISFILAAAMCLSMIPTWAYAENGTTAGSATPDATVSASPKGTPDATASASPKGTPDATASASPKTTPDAMAGASIHTDPLFGEGELETVTLSEINVADATHFMVRHWHATNDKGTAVDDTGESRDLHSVMIEGYIVPSDKNDGYEYYAAAYSGYHNAEVDNGDRFIVLGPTDTRGGGIWSSYLGTIGDGSIELMPLEYGNWDGTNEEEAYETFAGFSVASGGIAVTNGEDERGNDTFIITYSHDVHLVKAHTFYVRETMDVNGTADETVFGEVGIEKSPEHDTALVYTYLHDIKDADDTILHKSGEIVKIEKEKAVAVAEDGGEPAAELVPCTKAEEIAALGLKIGEDVELTKVYSTVKGLHTDKTASVHEEYVLDEEGNRIIDESKGEYVKTTGDGRTFNVDLESWYAEGFPPQVAMLIDASGSMAFTSDNPAPINVKDFGNDVVSYLSDKTGFVNKNNGFTKTEPVNFPSYSNLLGYYEFDGTKPNSGNDRNWFLNSQKKTPSDSFGDLRKEEHFAKVVAQSTSDSIDFSNAKPVKNSVDFIDVFTNLAANVGWGDVPANFSRDNGYNLTFNGTTNGYSGFMPEVVPDSEENLTISFSLMQSDETPCGNDVEILYIGAAKGANNYFHVIRSGTDIIATVEDTTGSTVKTTPVAKISDAFNGKVKHTLSFVVDNNKVTTYWDGLIYGKDVEIEKLGGTTVVFAPFKDDNVQGNFYLDNVYIFNDALSVQDIKTLNSVAGETLNLTTGKVNETTEAFLTPAEQDLLLNRRNTDNSLLGVTGYSYFVYNPGETTQEYVSLAYYTSNAPGFENKSNVNGDGWYYMSMTSLTEARSTTKQYRGIPSGKTFKDTITADKATTVSDSTSGEGVAPDLSSDLDDGNTGKTYTSTSNGGPVKLYIDKNGYLRCFYSLNGNDAFASYVYELNDEEYIKTETLRRAGGEFLIRLSESAPTAIVSAMKFSQATIPDTAYAKSTEYAVLLDWTSDPNESVNFLSTSRGSGDMRGSMHGYDESSTGIKQFNYGLTGGTNTHTGLSAFIEKQARKNEDNKDMPKYLIIFTDGEDDNIGKYADANNVFDPDNLKDYEEKLKKGFYDSTGNPRMDALKYAEELKNKLGYTIFTVLLNGGPVQEGSQKYSNAHVFLRELSGNDRTTTDAQKENYFFSVSKGEANLKGQGIDITGMNDADILTDIFAEEILDQIIKPLEDFTITEYIDPRFDLVDNDGALWQLKDKGIVFKVNEDGTTEEVDVKNGTTKIELDNDNTDVVAQNPYLRYDSGEGENDGMYYLEWTGQTIPGSAIGANRLAIWNARLTLRAKENFVGGNMIPTGGNKENQNYVRHQDETTSSSGTEYAERTFDETGDNITRHPSKGFPRTMVNVPNPENGSNDETTVYMGEKMSLNDIIGQVMTWEGSTDRDDLTSGIYWEYIMRYANSSSMDASELTAVFETAEDGGKRSFLIPYYYLPNNPYMSADPYQSQTGTDLHRDDCLGYLRYTWEVGTNRYPEETETNPGELVRDTRKRQSELSVKFIPYTEEERQSDEIFTISYLKELLMHDDEDSIDEPLLINILKMVLKNVLSETKTVDGKTVKTVDEELLNTILDETNELILGDSKDNDTFANVLKEVCAKYVVDESRLNDINKKIDENTIINMKGSNVNGTLTTDKDYKWDEEYKPVEGETLEDEAAIFDRIVRNVVSGDVALQIKIEKDGINDLLNNNIIKPGTKVEYTADLDMDGTVIGAFAAEYTVDGTLEEDKIIYADLNITNEKFIHNYGRNPRDNGWHRDDKVYELPTYGLPKGTYTIKNIQKSVSSKYLHFAEIGSADITDAIKTAFAHNNDMLKLDELRETYKAGDVVTDETTGEEIVLEEGNPLIGQLKPYSAFSAPVSGTAAYLGTNPDSIKNLDAEDTDSDKGTNTDARYALFNVDLVPDPLGTLTVSKTVTGAAGDTNKDFTFTVTLSDKDIDGQYGDMTFENGVATFTLKHGKSKTVKLPAGITYKVEETDRGDYALNSSGATGTIEKDKTVTAAFTNNLETPVPDPKGSLEISKTVTGTAGDKNKDFTFTLTLNDRSVNGNHGGMTFNNGVATFKLKHGESKAITLHLPESEMMGYTVTESDNDGYDVMSSGATGTIEKDKTAKAEFENKFDAPVPDPKGSLTVSKTVTGTAGDTDKDFTFTVTLSDTDIGGEYGDMTFENGVATFTLKHGESKTAADLPSGITYKVEETDRGDYTLTSSGATGTIEKDKTAKAEFENKFDAPVPDPKGSLTVSKTVTGTAGDKNKEFAFTLTLSDTSINGELGGMNFEEGVAEFTLKHGESKSVTLPADNITYKVEEKDSGNYTVNSVGEAGKIVPNDTVTAEFTNHLDKPVPSPTATAAAEPTPTAPTPTATAAAEPTPTATATPPRSGGGSSSSSSYVSIRVEKQWKDDNNAEGKRPDSITVNVMNGDEIVASHELNESNNWVYTFTKLPRTANGKTIKYTVEEEPVYGYASEYIKSTTGYIIRNEYTGEDTYTDGKPNSNGDDIPDLNHDDHYAYIIGYPEGDVRPNNQITRAEVATIFFRLLTDDSRSDYWSQSNDYSDVELTDWYNNAISTISNAGIVNGYLDGSFGPDAPITRAEFAAIAARFDSGEYDGEDKFDDIGDHWAKEYINRAADRGWINGYGDGTFKPNQPIIRSEAMTLINNVLNRRPANIDALLKGMITWSDNLDTSAWYYGAVQEATNSHYWEFEDDDHEIWTEMREVRDWEAFEKEDSTAVSAGSWESIYRN